MGDIIAMSNTNELVVMGAVVLLVTAAVMVPLAFFMGWAGLKPVVGHGSLRAGASAKASRRQWFKARFMPYADSRLDESDKIYKKMKPGKVKVLPSLAEDLAAGPNPVNGSFVTFAGRLCAYDDSQRIFYRHRDMIKIALGAGVGRVFWLPVIALPIALVLPLLIKMDESRQPLNLFPQLGPVSQLSPELGLAAVFVIYVLLSIVMWRALIWLRANTLIRRVENCLARLDSLRSRPVPAVEKNPLKGTALAAFMLLLSLGGGVVFWLQFVAPALGWMPGLVPLW